MIEITCATGTHPPRMVARFQRMPDGGGWQSHVRTDSRPGAAPTKRAIELAQENDQQRWNIACRSCRNSLVLKADLLWPTLDVLDQSGLTEISIDGLRVAVTATRRRRVES